MPRHKTPLLDQLETGPWPSFVSDIKAEASRKIATPQSVSACKHDSVRHEDWPDGGCIEICTICGMSRYHSEFDTSEWKMIGDLEAAREQIKTSLNMNKSEEK